jgi:hypothetical protein
MIIGGVGVLDVLPLPPLLSVRAIGVDLFIVVEVFNIALFVSGLRYWDGREMLRRICEAYSFVDVGFVC